MLRGFCFFLLTVLVAIAGYIVAGWKLIDAVYMVVITVFGVGYGEVVPIESPELRAFTMFVIVAGCSSVVYIVGGFIQMVTEGEIERAMGERRQNVEISKLRGHVIICGFGRLGQPLAKLLLEARTPFVIVDTSSERIKQAQDLGYLSILGSATEEKILELAGIEHARVLATVLPDDAANVFITLTARTMNAKVEIIARGEIASTERKLRAAGAAHVVLPADIGAIRIAHMITQPTALEFLGQNESRMNLNAQLEQIDLRVDQFPLPKDSPLHGKKISEVEFIGQGAFLIVGVKHEDGSMDSSPSKEFQLKSGDTLIIIGHKEDIPQFAAKYVSPRQFQYRGVRSTV
jgi:voltage-gated potassium channel